MPPTSGLDTNPNRIINNVTGQTAASLNTPPIGTIPVSLLNTNPNPISVTPTPVINAPDIKNLPPVINPNSTTPATGTPENFTSKLDTLIGQLGNKPTDTAFQVNTATSDSQRQLNEIQQQISMHQANSITHQESAAKSGETTGFASREQQNIARTDAIEGLRLSAVAQNLQGNFLLAEKLATDTVNAKYAQIEADAKTARQNIINIYDTLTPEQKKKANATLLSLNEKDTFITQKKDDAKTIQDYIATAIKNGLTDISVINKASQANSPTEAQGILAKYQPKTYFTTDENGQTVQYQKDANGGVVPGSRTVLGGTASGTGVNDPNSTDNLAASLVSGLMAPSELSKRTSNYNAVLKAADDYSFKTTGKHFDIAKANRNYKFANNSQTQNTLKYLGALTGGVGQTGNLDELLNISNGIGRTDFPALNNVENWAKIQTGDPALSAFYATATEVGDQVAKILQGGGTGSGTSDAKLTQALALFNSNFSQAQLTSTINALKSLLQNRAKFLIGDNPYLSDYATQFGTGGNVNNNSITVTDPTGTIHTFSTAEQANAFKKAAGIQ